MLIRATIPQSGYVPGETVVITGEISNQSKVKVEEVKFVLRKIIHYHSQTPHIKTLEEIENVCEQRINGEDPKALSQMRQELQIPAIPPTIATLSRVININYEIKVEVKVKAHINPVIRIPITIGTAPLVNYGPNMQLPPPMFAINPVQSATHLEEPIIRPEEPIAHPILNYRSSSADADLREFCFNVLFHEWFNSHGLISFRSTTKL